MRQITLTMLVLFATVSFCAAQVRELSFRQFGVATQEMQDIGLCAAHSTLPIGSKAKVINEATGKDVEVTIIRRMPQSSGRILDLSSAAAGVIGLPSGGRVIVETQEQSYPVIPPRSRGDGWDQSIISPGPYDIGRIRLFLHRDTGRFSLYSITERETYQAFFMDLDPRTSFLAVVANGRSYRLGESPAFRTSLGGTSEKPCLVFESSFLTIIQEFSFIQTASSSVVNGVRITITILNKTGQPMEVGLRFLLDTTLGEQERAHFTTDQRQIEGDTVIDYMSTERYWVSKNSRIGLIGSIVEQNVTKPDFVHFGNWKQLYDAIWQAPHVPGGNFNLLPYSIGDSAVCHYYEPARILPGEKRIISIVLASEEGNNYARTSPPVPPSLPEPAEPPPPEKPLPTKEEQARTLDNKLEQLIQEDLATLQYLMGVLDQYAASGDVSDEELDMVEMSIFQLKEKYGVF